MAEQWQLGERTAAERYDSHSVVFMTPFADALLERAQVTENDQLLDVACGTGIVGRRTKAHATGLDMNDNMLSVAREIAPELTWIHGSADDLPFGADTFDAVTCQQGLQFFPDTAKALEEMRRVVKRSVVVSMWAPISQNPYSEARAEAIEQFVSTGASAGMYAAMRDDGAEFLEKSFANTNFKAFEIEVVEAVVDLPEIGEWSAVHVLGTPQGSLYEAAGNEAQDAFQAYIRASLGQYAQDDGTYGIPFASYVVTATK